MQKYALRTSTPTSGLKNVMAHDVRFNGQGDALSNCNSVGDGLWVTTAPRDSVVALPCGAELPQRSTKFMVGRVGAVRGLLKLGATCAARPVVPEAAQPLPQPRGATAQRRPCDLKRQKGTPRRRRRGRMPCRTARPCYPATIT
eukprot:264750-Chlamydomonas_euryale.AAC.4